MSTELETTKRRFKITLHWYGKDEVFWRHSNIENIKRAKKAVLSNAIIALAKITGIQRRAVSLYIRDKQHQRWEVHEQ